MISDQPAKVKRPTSPIITQSAWSKVGQIPKVLPKILYLFITFNVTFILLPFRLPRSDTWSKEVTSSGSDVTGNPSFVQCLQFPYSPNATSFRWLCLHKTRLKHSSISKDDWSRLFHYLLVKLFQHMVDCSSKGIGDRVNHRRVGLLNVYITVGISIESAAAMYS